MSKDNLLPKQNSIYLIILLFLWLSIVFLSTYVLYYFVFPAKMYKFFPKNTEWFVEFRLDLIDDFSDFLPKEYYPWFYSYKDKIKGDMRWAVLFYEGKKIDALLTWNEHSSLKLLESIKLPWEWIIHDNDIILLDQSAVPPCIFKKNTLFCSQDKDVLLLLLNDKSKFRQNKNSLLIENNLHYRNDVFVFFGEKFLNNFPLIKNRFNWFGISLKEIGSQLDWLFYWSMIQENSFPEKDRTLRKSNFENFVSSSWAVIALWWINLEKHINNSFKFANQENPYYALLFKWLLEWVSKNIFWSEFWFFNNILPLFSWEFLFVIKESNNKYDFEIIAEKTGSLDILFENFKNQSKKFLPYKETFQYKQLTLEKIVAKYWAIKNFDEILKWSKILWWEIKWKPWWFYFIEKNWLIRIATNLDILIDSLDTKAPKISSHLPSSPYSFEFGFISTNKLNSLFEFIGFDKKIIKDKEVWWQTIWFNGWIQTKFVLK